MKYISDIQVRDATMAIRTADLKIPEMAQRFMDPADKRYCMKITFKGVPIQFPNMLIRIMQTGLEVKCLEPTKITYLAKRPGTVSHAEPREESGHDLGIY